MDGILKSAECFQKILDSVLSKSNLQGMKSQLLENHKIKEDDVDIAIKLMACIIFFNNLFFRSINTFFGFIVHRNKFGFFAQYVKRTKKEKDGYIVYTNGLSDLLEKKGALVVFTKKGKIIKLAGLKKERRHSLEESLIGIAAHEVRHRLQHYRLIKQLRKKDIPIAKNKRLARVMKFVDLLLKGNRKIWRKEGKPEWFIEKQTKTREFDAKIIGEIVKNRIHYGCTLKQIYKVILTQI